MGEEMKTMVVITQTEGGCDRDDYTQTDIDKLKTAIAKEWMPKRHHETVRLFESMQIGDEADGDPLNASWVFMLKQKET